MEISLTVFCLIYLFLTTSVSVVRAGFGKSNSNQITEYELDLNTKEDNNNSNYLKVSLEGLESHMVYGKPNHVASKVTDGSTEIWKKVEDLDKCIGSLLTNKGIEKLLAMLVIMKKISLNSDPLEIKFYKFENNKWNETSRDGYFRIVEQNKPDNSNATPVDVDVSETKNGPELLSANDCPIGFGLRLFLPNNGEKIGNLIDGTKKIWEGQEGNEGYPLYFLLATKSDSKKFGFAVMKNSNGYEEKYFKYDNTWEGTEFSKLKTYIVKSIGFAGLRGFLGK